MKATHKGECQLCGSRQMLPDGRLAKHGYTVRWGFFSGVCGGSGGLPFEQSTDLIAAAVAQVEADVLKMEAEIARLSDLNSEANAGTLAMERIYTEDRYQWVQCNVVNFSATDRGTYNSYSADYETVGEFAERRGSGRAKITKRIEAYSESFNLSSVRHWVHFLNAAYAKRHLAPINAQRRQWLAWQKERVAAWTPKPLAPR